MRKKQEESPELTGAITDAEETFDDFVPTSIKKLTKDLRQAAALLTKKEVRYLVDAYYQFQKARIVANNQCRTPEEGEAEPHEALTWHADIMAKHEEQIKNLLGCYAKSTPVGRWMLSICGIGPVISAGLLAHIDITKAPTCGHILSFAGLNPLAKKEKGKLRPWNGDLKTLCWKIGQSFCKVCNRPNGYYGRVYKERKLYEQPKNEKFEYADQAKAKLESCNFNKDTDAYKWYSKGMLPPAHIQRRAERYATTRFLYHLHDVWYRDHYKTAPPLPYPLAILGHAHYEPPPNT